MGMRTLPLCVVLGFNFDQILDELALRPALRKELLVDQFFLLILVVRISGNVSRLEELDFFQIEVLFLVGQLLQISLNLIQFRLLFDYPVLYIVDI